MGTVRVLSGKAQWRQSQQSELRISLTHTLTLTHTQIDSWQERTDARQLHMARLLLPIPLINLKCCIWHPWESMLVSATDKHQQAATY